MDVNEKVADKMKLESFYISPKSIGFKLVFGVLIVLVPIIILMIYNNFYSISVVHDKVAVSNKNMISLYLKQIDTNLENVDLYLTNLMANDPNMQIMEYSEDENDFSMAKILLNAKMSKDILLYKPIKAFFIYSQGKKDFLGVSNDNGVIVSEKSSIREYIKSLVAENVNPEQLIQKWMVHKIDQDYYIFRILRMGDIYFGAWVTAKELMTPLSMVDLGKKGVSLLVTEQGVPMSEAGIVQKNGIRLTGDFHNYYLSGNLSRFLVVGEKSQKGDFSLVALIEDRELLASLPYLQNVIKLISICSIILIPICFLFLRRSVIRPLNRIMKAMKRIRDGNLDERIEPYPTSLEFMVMNETFNNMSTQIKELKISVYEEQLDKQKEELQNLQLQINPHFFFNTLNMIYSLAQTQKYKIIQELTLCLVNYFRYISKYNMSFVPLKDELQHVRNYIRIQELRFPTSLKSSIEAEESLLDIDVPPLVLQTFVENIVKHAVTMDALIYLIIQITEFEKEGMPFIRIIIQDTGKGFPEKVLSQIRSADKVIDGRGEHIGIWNVQRRLKILYQSSAELNITNLPSAGAQVEILLPRNHNIRGSD